MASVFFDPIQRRSRGQSGADLQPLCLTWYFHLIRADGNTRIGGWEGPTEAPRWRLRSLPCQPLYPSNGPNRWFLGEWPSRDSCSAKKKSVNLRQMRAVFHETVEVGHLGHSDLG